jgi:anti-anti-sigma regulatory factor
MSNEQFNTAPPEVGAASWGSAGALESAWPQARAAGQGDFGLALERDGSETAVLVLAGELDMYRAPAIEDALIEAIGSKLDSDRCHRPLLGAPPAEDAQGLDAKVRHLAVDLRLVTFIDATTLVLLLGASRRQHAQGGQLLILVGPQTPMTAFKASGFDRLLAIRRLEDERRTALYASEVARGLV